MNTQVSISEYLINIRQQFLFVFSLLEMNTFLSSDEMESTPTSRNLRARIQRQEEDSAVRRSSRITRYKLDAKNQSVLYDRLITKYALI